MEKKRFSSGAATGIVCAVFAAAAYGTNPLFAMPLYGAGFTADAILLLRYFFAMLMLGAILLVRRESFAMPAKELFSALCLGALFALSSLTLFLSYREMDVGIAATILFIYPLMTAVGMWLIFREKTALLTWFAILLSVGGILLLYRQSDGTYLSTKGVVLILISALTYAAYLIWLNRSRLRNESPVKVTFYVLTSGLLLYACRLGAGCGKFGDFTPFTWLNVVLLALIATVLSLVCTAVAVRKAGATVTSVLGALEPVTAVVCGMLFFQEKLTVRILTGILLILASVILVVLSRKKGPEKC